MTRIHSSGFEHNFSGVPGEFSSSVGVITIQSTTKRSGNYAIKTFNLISGQSQRATLRIAFAAGNGPYFTRIYFYLVTPPTAANTIMRLSGNGATIQVKLNANRTLLLADEVGTIGTSTTALNLNQWYRLEMKFDSTLAAGNHEIHLYVDGIEVIGSLFRNFTNPQVQQLDFGGNAGAESQTIGEWYWDDAAINDNTGTIDTSLPGEGRIIHLKANGNGDANVGVSRGGVDTGADWSQVSEETPNDLTDYVDVTTTAGVIWTAIEDAPIGDFDIIKFVAPGARVTAASAATTNWKPSIKSKSGGMEIDGTLVSLSTVAWGHHDDTTASQNYKLHQYVDPQTGGQWTRTLLNNTQIGAKTTDGTPAARISTMWALVEYQTALYSGVAHGWADLDFGPTFGNTGNTEASTRITYQSGISNQSKVELYTMGATTPSHSEDEHRIENLLLIPISIESGIGFTANGECSLGTAIGLYRIHWVWK